MPVEASLLKPIVDAILGLARAGNKARLKRDAANAVREAIRELLQVDPDESGIEAKIAIAKAAGLISEDVLLADDMLRKVRAKKTSVGRVGRTERKRGTTESGSAGSAATKKAPVKHRSPKD
ncbi:MAG TPA: hypothetical protein VGH80_12795 [Xanthomonadaceae bacterium]